MNSKLARLLASGAGAGTLPVAPGTWGSLEAVLIAALLTSLLGLQAHWVLAVSTVLAAAVGVPAATRVARDEGREDPSVVVIDEIAGQWLTLLFSDLSAVSLVAGFFLFRLFDIVKPPPVRQSERLAEGWGIVADDLVAGVYAGLALWFFGWMGLW